MKGWAKKLRPRASWFRPTWRKAGVLGALLAAASAWWIPAESTRSYGTFWSGVTVAACLYFWVGFIRFSKPAREADGSITQEWLILFTEPVVIGLPLAYLWIFRVINPAPAFTDALTFQFRFGATIFIIAASFQLWVATVWTVRQVHSRRELRKHRG